MRNWILIGVAVVVGVGVAAWAASRFLTRPEPIIAYSLQDRRMTFAVLPFKAPADDSEVAKVASTMTEVRMFRYMKKPPLSMNSASACIRNALLSAVPLPRDTTVET